MSDQQVVVTVTEETLDLLRKGAERQHLSPEQYASDLVAGYIVMDYEALLELEEEGEDENEDEEKKEEE
jgi:hypothetical protein